MGLDFPRFLLFRGIRFIILDSVCDMVLISLRRHNLQGLESFIGITFITSHFTDSFNDYSVKASIEIETYTIT